MLSPVGTRADAAAFDYYYAEAATAYVEIRCPGLLLCRDTRIMQDLRCFFYFASPSARPMSFTSL